MRINPVTKRITISLMTAFVLMNTINCDSGDDLLDFPLENYIISSFIKCTMRIEKSMFEVGESVNVEFIIKNISFKKMDVGLPGISTVFEITIKKGSELVFFDPQRIPAVGWSLTLERGESKEYSYTWDGRNNFFDSVNYGQYVLPGIYTVTMRLMSYTHPCPGISFNITIK